MGDVYSRHAYNYCKHACVVFGVNNVTNIRHCCRGHQYTANWWLGWLLVAFKSLTLAKYETAVWELLSRAPKLRFHTQYKSTFIAPDMTRFQQEKHKKLVDELRKRRQQGEQNLIIKNGLIVRREQRTQPMSLPAQPWSRSPPLIDLNEEYAWQRPR